MSQSQREIQVGLAVILSVIVLIAGILWFKNFRFAGGIDSYAVDFSTVEGLQVRDRVQVRGIRMGAVDDFQIVDGHVRVTFHIDKGVPLREDTRVQLVQVGIVGEMVIEIDPGMGAVVPEGHVFQGKVAISLLAMSESASAALDDLRGLAGDLHELVADLREEDRIPGTLRAAESAAAGLDGLLQENREDFRALVENFRYTSDALREVLAGPDSSLAQAVHSAARTFTRADSVMLNLEQTTAVLAEVAARLEAGEGTAGRLLADESLYARAESTLTAANALLIDVRRNPRRYFKFNFIDF